MLRSILIGVDGSDSTSAALELGIRWANRYSALLVGLGVVNEPAICRPEPVPIGAGHFKQDRDRTLLAEAHRHIDEGLSIFERRCAKEDVRHQVFKKIGSPAAEIVRLSRPYDLIMLGHAAQVEFDAQDGRLGAMWQVLRQSSKPIVAVPEEARLDDNHRVLVAYNGSPEADRAIQTFEGLGFAQEAEIHVLSIDADRDTADRLANQAATFMHLHNVNAIGHCGTFVASPSQLILDNARRLNASLIVMGACGRARWREVIFGSNTWDVISGSEVPVFLCH